MGIAHMDCDAFFASVEKRDNPELKSRPVLIGGTGPRAVVATACYIARSFGCHSAQPMAQARKLCPQAVIIRGDHGKYAQEGGILRDMMRELTPLIEPLSIDEAFMDLRGTERLHGGPPVQTLIKLQNRIEKERGITVSIGLSHNKFLAKAASDMDKPRGFSIIGEAETLSLLARQEPGFVFGVGKNFAARLKRDGILHLGQIQQMDEMDMAKRYGKSGLRLARLSRGEDFRPVNPVSERKSVSCETTFDRDIAALPELEAILWRMGEKASRLAKAKNVAGYTLTLKLKDHRHQIRTRSVTLDHPVQLADTMFRELAPKLAKETGRAKFRLLGVGLSTLVEVDDAFEEDVTDLLDPAREKRARAEKAMDQARQKFGLDAIGKGRNFRPDDKDQS